MRKKVLVGIIAASAAGLLALNSPAMAVKKHGARAQLSYEEAWAFCAKFVQEGVPSWDQTQQRYSRGGACMMRFGYRL